MTMAKVPFLNFGETVAISSSKSDKSSISFNLETLSTSTDSIRDERRNTFSADFSKSGYSEDWSRTGSIFSSYLNLTTVIIAGGLSVITYPFATRLLGIGLMVIVTLFFSMLNSFTSYLLLICQHKTSLNSYYKLTDYALGRKGKIIAMIALIGNMVGVCISLLQIFRDVMVPLMMRWFPRLEFQIFHNPYFLVFFAAILLYPLCCFRNVDKLSYTSGVTLLFVLFFLVAAIVNLGTGLHKNAFQGPVQVFRVNLNSFLAIPLISLQFTVQFNQFSIYRYLRSPKITKMMKSLYGCQSTAVVIYCLGGIACYVAFRDKTNPDILNNFRHGFMDNFIGLTLQSPVPELVQLSFAGGLLLTFPLYHYEARDNLDALLFGDFHTWRKVRFYSIAMLINIVSATIAVQVEDVSLVVGFVGSVCSPVIAYMIPTLSYMTISSKEDAKTRLAAKAVFCVGWFVCIIGLAGTIKAAIG